MEIILSVDLSVDKLKKIDKHYDEQKVILLSANIKERNAYESQIKQFVNILCIKEQSLTGRVNKSSLKRVIKKWKLLLGEEMPISKTKKYSQMGNKNTKIKSKPQKAIPNKWFEQIRELLDYSKTLRKLHPDFIQPTTSQNPEVAEIIEFMKASD